MMQFISAKPSLKEETPDVGMMESSTDEPSLNGQSPQVRLMKMITTEIPIMEQPIDVGNLKVEPATPYFKVQRKEEKPSMEEESLQEKLFKILTTDMPMMDQPMDVEQIKLELAKPYFELHGLDENLSLEEQSRYAEVIKLLIPELPRMRAPIDVGNMQIVPPIHYRKVLGQGEKPLFLDEVVQFYMQKLSDDVPMLKQQRDFDTMQIEATKPSLEVQRKEGPPKDENEDNKKFLKKLMAGTGIVSLALYFISIVLLVVATIRDGPEFKRGIIITILMLKMYAGFLLVASLFLPSEHISKGKRGCCFKYSKSIFTFVSLVVHFTSLSLNTVLLEFEDYELISSFFLQILGFIVEGIYFRFILAALFPEQGHEMQETVPYDACPIFGIV